MDTTETLAAPDPAPKKGKTNQEVFRAAMEKSAAPTRDAETSLQGEESGPIMLKSTPLPKLSSVAEPVAGATAPAQTPVVSVPPDDLARARLALIRSSMLPSEVDALEPTAVLERGQKAQKRLDADDEAHRLANEWRSRQGQEPKDGKKEAQPLSTERAPSAPDLKGTLKPLADALLLDDAGLELMERTFGTLVQNAVAPLREELTKSRQPDAAAAQRAEQVAVETARAKLVDRFPELADPVRFREVYAEMEALATRPRYASIQSATEAVERLMLDASGFVGLQDSGGPNTSQDADRKRQRAESRSTIPPSSNETPPQTLQEKQWAYFKHIREHPGDIVGAKRVAGYA